MHESWSDFEPKNPQVSEDQSQVLASTTQDHVDGITLSTFEVIAMHRAIIFHVSDDRFDGITSFEFAPDAALVKKAVGIGVGSGGSVGVICAVPTIPQRLRLK